MADDVNIRVGAPGAKRTEADLKRVAAAERRVGDAGKKGGKKAAEGAREASGAMDELGRSVGVNTRVFSNWKLGIAVAVGAMIEGLRRSFEYVKQLNREFREGYREFVGLTQQASTGQLAQIRGETEAATAKWMLRTGQKYAIKPEAAREAAFEIESGISPEAVGGRGALEEIQAAAFQTMRAYQASGRTVSGLAIAGYEAGVARRPEEFKAFFAKAGAYAEKSRVSLEQLGQVAARLLPAAVAAGFTPDQFFSMAAAMSFRISDPSRLTTTLERMIRAAGTTSTTLERAAEETGRSVGAMSTVDVMKLQSDLIARATRAGGPIGAMAMAEKLGFGAELAQAYQSGFDPEVQRRMGGLMGVGRVSSWAAVAQRYADVRRRPEARSFAAQIRRKLDEYEGAERHAELSILEDWAAGKVARQMGRGEDIPGVWETLPYGKERARRQVIVQRILSELSDLSVPGAFEMTGAERRERRQLHEDVFGVQDYYRMYGTDEALMQRAAIFIQNFGGTQYYNQDRRDPSGRPRAARGRY